MLTTSHWGVTSCQGLVCRKFLFIQTMEESSEMEDYYQQHKARHGKSHQVGSFSLIQTMKNQFNAEESLKIISRTVSRCHHYEVGVIFIQFFRQRYFLGRFQSNWASAPRNSFTLFSSPLKFWKIDDELNISQWFLWWDLYSIFMIVDETGFIVQYTFLSLVCCLQKIL